jgi:coatomer protein complex subunit alpha (xenin)
LVNYNRRTKDETDSRKLLPHIPRDLETITTIDMQEGFTAMRTNKLDAGVVTFKNVLQSILVNIVSSQVQVDEAKVTITKAMEYALAMSTELERRKLSAEGGESEEQVKRQLELSAYFTVPKMDVAHRQLALMAAMKLAFSNKQFSSALSFASRVLANGGAPKLLDQVCLVILF